MCDLDSLDLDTNDKKSLRVRSWYLYEQYKSLEKHQLDAAQKLRNRSYQDKILRQVLSERRARRKLYDQFGLCQSESGIQKTISYHTAHAPSLTVGQDDFFESFTDQDDELVTRETNLDFNEAVVTNKTSVEDFKSVTELNDNVSYSGSVTSVVENVILTNNGDNNDNTEFDNVEEHAKSLDENLILSFDKSINEYKYIDNEDVTPMTIVEDIHKQLDSVREDIQCLEDITKLGLEDSSEDLHYLEDNKRNENAYSNNGSEHSLDDCLSKVVQQENKNEYSMVISIWSRLFSYALQIVRLNQGNCYCDYNSQLLTAVLACDILRRGVNQICNILQPYVSPINYANDDNSDIWYKSGKTKKSLPTRKIIKIIENKPHRRVKLYNNSSRLARRNYSENCWNSCHRRTSFENNSKPKFCRRVSEPWRSPYKDPFKRVWSSSKSSVRSQISKESMSRHMFKGCPCCKKAVNPMLKIARYIDNILKDIHDV